MQGNLEIWKGVINGWNSYYIVIKDSILTICKNKQGESIGKIHLGVARLKTKDDNLDFIINNGMEDFEFRTKNMDEKVQWLLAMYKNN